MDDLLEDGQPITGMQIEELLAFLRVGGRVVDISRNDLGKPYGGPTCQCYP